MTWPTPDPRDGRRPAVYVIAEAGVNHDGDPARAKQLIDVAADAGADAIKFQTFRADQLVRRDAKKAAYQARATGDSESQFEMIQKLELTPEDHEALTQHAKARGIAFLSTPFDLASLRLLTERFGLRSIKVPSGEITNAPFLLAIARMSPRVLLSTGMSTLADVEAALGVLAFGFTARADAAPGSEHFERAFASEEGQLSLRERVILLHCTSEYPAPIEDVNLRAMDTMRKAFGLPVGYSDHTIGIHVSLAAVALGACVIEKHFTLDRRLPGPDHSSSIEPGELRELIRLAREIEQALGDGIKRPMASEWKNRDVVRRSVVAARPIRRGEIFTEENLACRRPGLDTSPFRYWQMLGQAAARNYAVDESVDG